MWKSLLFKRMFYWSWILYIYVKICSLKLDIANPYSSKDICCQSWLIENCILCVCVQQSCVNNWGAFQVWCELISKWNGMFRVWEICLTFLHFRFISKWKGMFWVCEAPIWRKWRSMLDKTGKINIIKWFQDFRRQKLSDIWIQIPT